MENHTQKLKQFLVRYRDFRHKHEQLKLQSDKSAFGHLLRTYGMLRSLHEKHNREQAYHFNLFDILKVNHLEAKTHSPMLHHLLDPQASHGQGLLFYELFLKMMEKKGIASATNRFKATHPRQLEVVMERHTGNGFIDILIKGPKFAIVIENKIYAPDQNEQLSRYFRYCCNILNLKHENIVMLYLSPHGKDPALYSYHNKGEPHQEAKNCTTCISYHEDIAPFLKTAMKQCASPKVNHTLQQYLQLIKTL